MDFGIGRHIAFVDDIDRYFNHIAFLHAVGAERDTGKQQVGSFAHHDGAAGFIVIIIDIVGFEQDIDDSPDDPDTGGSAAVWHSDRYCSELAGSQFVNPDILAQGLVVDHNPDTESLGCSHPDVLEGYEKVDLLIHFRIQVGW